MPIYPGDSISSAERQLAGAIQANASNERTYPVKHTIARNINLIVTMDDKPVNVSMTANTIQIGCTQITIDAAKKLLEVHNTKFSKPDVFHYQTI